MGRASLAAGRSLRTGVAGGTSGRANGPAAGRFALVLAVALMMPGCSPESGTGMDASSVTGEEAKHAFFHSVAERCGEGYPGRAVLAPGGDDLFAPAPLHMHIGKCDEHEVRITLEVGDDDSRSWLLRRSDAGLLFTQQRRREDGSLDGNSGWGGWATDGGSETFQHFPDHRWEPYRGPKDQRSVWRLRIDPVNGQFVYYLDRGIEPAYRLVFHMGQSERVPPVEEAD